MKSLNSLLQQTGLSQADIARAIDVSSAAVSQAFAGKYKGDQELSRKIRSYLEAQTDNPEMPAEVWQENNNTRFIRYITDRAASRKKMSLIVGKSGTGKTSTLKKIQEERPESILIELDPKTSYSALLDVLCQATGIERKRKNSATALSVYAYFKKSKRILLIDEGEQLTMEALEGLRRLWDKTSTPIIVAGTDDLEQSVMGKKREQTQLFTRIYGIWRMKDLEQAELQELCQQYGVASRHTQKIKKLASNNLRMMCWIMQEMQDFSNIQQIPMSEVDPAHVSELLML